MRGTGVYGTDESRPLAEAHVLHARHAGEHVRPIERTAIVDDDELERAIHARGAGGLEALQRQLELLVEGDDDRGVEPAFGTPREPAQRRDRIHAAAAQPPARTAPKRPPDDGPTRAGEIALHGCGCRRGRGALGDHLVKRVDSDVRVQGATHDDGLLIPVHAVSRPGAAQRVLGA